MNYLQQQASDPNHSVWVSASAGTGKTKILIDRILRLLISGVEFQKILCLTFTNAAALEIQSRINNKLAQFANMDICQLEHSLSLILTRRPSTKELKYTKDLYYKLLNSKEKINIHTIHSFCLKILKSFLFEANINPSFQIVDSIKIQEILVHIKNQIYLDPAYDHLTNFFLANFHEATIKDIYSEIVEQKLKFKKLYVTIENVPTFNMLSTWQNLISKLRSDCNNIDTIIKSSTAYNLQLSFLQSEKSMQEFFLTKDSKKRKNILSKDLRHKYPQLLEELEHIQEKVFQLDQLHKLEEIVNYSNLLFILSQVLLNKYELYKSERSLLDYDDLVYLTKILLIDDKAKDWILYKCNKGIDHLLVDEAQDTNPEQWEIIGAIISDFYLYDNKSIFIVGDEKQSIFSFQGADLASFYFFYKNLQEKLLNNNRSFKNITLEYSYRSTVEIIDVVFNILEQIKCTNSELFISDNPKILPFRSHNGRVEVWPLVVGEKEKELFWPLPQDYKQSFSAQQLLAKKIADFIKDQIVRQVILPTTNLPAKEADFMILVRKRDELTTELVKQLKCNSLQVESNDIMILNKNLSVMDLIGAAKFTLLPQDDLNLANLLKSPIIGLSEEELQNLAINRGNNSIWDFLCQHINSNNVVVSNVQSSLLEDSYNDMLPYINIYKKLNYLMQIYKVSNARNFFSIIIDCLGLREILIKENGFDSNNAMNELLRISSNYVDMGNSSLQSFIYWFENNEIEIKRDIEQSNKIRILTVHGSKGLQSPIVILCDTTTIPINKSKFIWTQDGSVISSMQSSNSPQIFQDLKQQEQQKDLQEYVRLLYVALTRAEDILIICGYKIKDKLPQNCWYELITKSMQHYTKVNQDNIMVYETSNENFKFIDKDSLCTQSSIEPIVDSVELDKKSISWYHNITLISEITKSTRQSYKANTPLMVRDYLEYGRVFHKILEDCIIGKELLSLKKHPLIKSLTPVLQRKINKNINRLLKNKEFTDLANHDLKAEVNIGLTLGEDTKVGRIDLVSIYKNILTIVDYKSDSNPPGNVQLIPESYIDQLNFYRHVMQKLYKKNIIICKILWLENSSFMTI